MRPKHQRFVEEYTQDWNATAAYERAGYRARGHSAEVNASRLCKRPDVADAIGVVLARRHAAAIPSGSKFIRIGRRGVFNLETGHFER